MGTDALPITILAVTLVALLVGVVGLAVLVSRRVDGRWSTLGWGALAFVGSQVVRLPLLALATALLPPARAAVTVPALAVLSSGLAEEPARWLILRFAARRDRRWRDGVLFGVGHGSVEALLLVGPALAGTIALLLAGPAALEALAEQPGAREAVEAQIGAVREAPWSPVLGLWERALAITFHVAASVLVVRSVREGRPLLLAAAIVLHIAFNGAAVGAVAAGLAPVLVEVMLSVLTVGLVVLIAAERRRDTDGSGGGPPEPTPPDID